MNHELYSLIYKWTTKYVESRKPLGSTVYGLFCKISVREDVSGLHLAAVKLYPLAYCSLLYSWTAINPRIPPIIDAVTVRNLWGSSVWPSPRGNQLYPLAYCSLLYSCVLPYYRGFTAQVILSLQDICKGSCDVVVVLYLHHVPGRASFMGSTPGQTLQNLG